MSVIEPVVATVTVPCDPDRAFALFTDGIDRWWPVAGHSMGEGKVEAIVCEGGTGGRIFERWEDGTQHEWGRITSWAPPVELAFTWRPNPETVADTLVSVAFEPIEGGTLVRLTHTGWEALGDKGAAARADYDAGWPHVLTRYVDVTLGPVAHRSFARTANGETWRRLPEPGDPLDDEAASALLDAAHASSWHWRAAGGVVERARAEWLVARAHVVCGDAGTALRHARLSHSLCESAPAEVADFDVAYAAEGLARAHAAAGDLETAARWRADAVALGAGIADPEDRGIFDGDLAAGPWFGLGEGG